MERDDIAPSFHFIVNNHQETMRCLQARIGPLKTRHCLGSVPGGWKGWRRGLPAYYTGETIFRYCCYAPVTIYEHVNLPTCIKVGIKGGDSRPRQSPVIPPLFSGLAVFFLLFLDPLTTLIPRSLDYVYGYYFFSGFECTIPCQRLYEIEAMK